MPAFVTTKLSKIRRASWLIPNPQTYVRSALATLGVVPRTPGYMAHSLQVSEISLICYSNRIYIMQVTLVRNVHSEDDAQSLVFLHIEFVS